MRKFQRGARIDLRASTAFPLRQDPRMRSYHSGCYHHGTVLSIIIKFGVSMLIMIIGAVAGEQHLSVAAILLELSKPQQDTSHFGIHSSDENRAAMEGYILKLCELAFTNDKCFSTGERIRSSSLL
jgi:hypothetical protein